MRNKKLREITLVELIVLTVILDIVASIAVLKLSGYIDKIENEGKFKYFYKIHKR